MIFSVHARFGEELARNLKNQPGLLPLKEANFAEIAIPYDKIKCFLDSVSGSPAAMAAELHKRMKALTTSRSSGSSLSYSSITTCT